MRLSIKNVNQLTFTIDDEVYVRHNGFLVLTVWEKGEVTAHATLYQPTKENRYLYLSGLFVCAEYRRKGLGKRLLREAQKICSRNGLPMHLDVFPGNEPALSLYKKCGFVTVEEGFVGVGATRMSWRPD